MSHKSGLIVGFISTGSVATSQVCNICHANFLHWSEIIVAFILEDDSVYQAACKIEFYKSEFSHTFTNTGVCIVTIVQS